MPSMHESYKVFLELYTKVSEVTKNLEELSQLYDSTLAMRIILLLPPPFKYKQGSHLLIVRRTLLLVYAIIRLFVNLFIIFNLIFCYFSFTKKLFLTY